MMSTALLTTVSDFAAAEKFWSPKLVSHRCPAFVMQREGKSVTSSNADELKERRPKSCL
jgi:hypothetical protein